MEFQAQNTVDNDRNIEAVEHQADGIRIPDGAAGRVEKPSIRNTLSATLELEKAMPVSTSQLGLSVVMLMAWPIPVNVLIGAGIEKQH